MHIKICIYNREGILSELLATGVHIYSILNFLRVLVLNVSWHTNGILAWTLAYGIFYVV